MMTRSRSELGPSWPRASEPTAAKPMPEPRIFGDYVFSPAKNAFNRKTSWWISKKGYAVARYCFTADTEAEVERQLQSTDGYIKMFEEGLK